MPDMSDTDNTNATGSAPPAAAPAAAAPPQTTAPDLGAAGQMTPAQMAPVPMDTLTPPERNLKNESWGSKVYHGVLNALGGGGDVSYARDPATGKLTATPVAVGPGTQWKRIIAGALSGFGAAAQAGTTGPGGGIRGAGAGVNAGLRMGMQRDQDARQQANENFDAEQKAATQQANLALLNHQIAKSTFDLGRAQVNASVEDSDRETNFEQVISAGGAGSQDMGVFPDFQSVMKAFKEVPALHDHQAGGRIASIPHINGAGKVDGVHAALVTPDWLNSKVNLPLPITTRTYKDGKMEENTFTIPAGTLTGQQTLSMFMAQSKDALEDWTKVQDINIKKQQQQMEAPKIKAETAQAYAAADKDRSESVPGGGGPGAQEVQNDISQGLADGRYLMGKDIPLRTSKDQTTAAQYTKAANDYSMAHYGLPYSPEIIRQESHMANEPKTQAFLSGIDRMVGTPGMPGQLDQVLDLAKRAGLGNTAPVNEVKLWVREHLGNDAAKQFETGMSDTQTALGTLIGNPLMGSGESDLKLRTAQRQFGSNPTLENLRGTVATTKEILERARGQMARNNRYIQQRYGDSYSPAAQGTRQQPPQTAPGGGAGVVKVQPGEPTAKAADGGTLVVRNGQWVTAQQ
jgi:hypothetical protein